MQSSHGSSEQWFQYFFVGNKNNIYPPWNQHSTWKWMVGIRSFPFGAQPIFRGELLVPKRECSWWWFGLHLLVSPLGKFIQFDELFFSGWWFPIFSIFHPSIWGNDPFWLIFFHTGWFNHQPVLKWLGSTTNLEILPWKPLLMERPCRCITQGFPIIHNMHCAKGHQKKGGKHPPCGT